MCVCVCVFFFPDSLFTFEDENNHEDEIWLKVFPRILRKYTKESSQGYFLILKEVKPNLVPRILPFLSLRSEKTQLVFKQTACRLVSLEMDIIIVIF